VPVVPPKLIENRYLVRDDVPGIDVQALPEGGWDGDEGDAATEWARLWTFALTFHAYRFFGGDDDVSGRVGNFGQSVQQSYFEHGRLPQLDLALLRTCLFYEQR
jgi:hypothetical protein